VPNVPKTLSFKNLYFVCERHIHPVPTFAVAASRLVRYEKLKLKMRYPSISIDICI
jgi:hypothetical protein